MSSRYQHCVEHRNTSEKQIAAYLTIWVEILFSHSVIDTEIRKKNGQWEEVGILLSDTVRVGIKHISSLYSCRQYCPHPSIFPFHKIFFGYVKASGMPSINQTNAKTNLLYPSILTFHYSQYKNSQKKSKKWTEVAIHCVRKILMHHRRH